MDTRGAASLLGLILLIGLVVLVSTGLLVMANATLTDQQHHIEKERVEQAMVELNSQLYQAAQHDDTSTQVDLETTAQDAVVREETGSIMITSAALERDINTAIGTIEWEGDDGTTIASEAGAVFAETGNETRVVSAPPFAYDLQTHTLNLPLVTVVGEQDLESGAVSFTQTNVTPYAKTNVVENESLQVTVESKYCVGWQTYFRTEVGASAIQEKCGADSTMTAELGRLEIGDTFTEGVNYHSNGEVADQHGKFENPGAAPVEPLDDLIHELIADANQPEESGMDVEPFDPTADELDAGTYYVDGDLQLEDELDVDLAAGNVTLIVNGSVRGNGDIDVVNPNGTAFRIYAGGEEFDVGGRICTEGCIQEAKHIQIYGTSEMAVQFDPGGNQGAHFEGIIYAVSPTDKDWEHNGNCDGYQFALQAGQEDFYGSIVTHSACAQSQSTDFQYDESLDDGVAAFPPGISMPPRLTYLNVVNHEVEVQSD